MQTRRRLLVTALAGSAAGCSVLTPGDARSRADSSPWDRVAGILARIKAPTFPDRDFALTSYGASGDGATDCTRAFASAIEACTKAGGGRVVVPPGTWLTGPFALKSNVNLHVENGARILFQRDPKAYLPLVFTRWEGVELMNYSPFIYAFEQENIALTGEGIIDGNCDSEHWWPWRGETEYGWREGMPNQLPARAKLFQMAEDNVPVERRVFGEGSYLRPNFIQPYRCKNVLIEGVTLNRAPMWQVHPVLSTNVTIRKLNIDSNGPNNDGVNIESCRDTLVEDTSFNTGDDCIAINSGRNADGRRLATPAEYIVIRRCHMQNGQGALTVGSQISGGARYIFGEDCEMSSPDLEHAIRFKNNALRGGVVEHIYFRNIEVGQVAHAVITVDFNHEEGADGPFTPVLRDVIVENLTAQKAAYAIDAQGLPKAPAYDILLKDCDFQNVEKPMIVKNVKNLDLVNVRINGQRVGPRRSWFWF
jgi:polygalacturonase